MIHVKKIYWRMKQLEVMGILCTLGFHDWYIEPSDENFSRLYTLIEFRMSPLRQWMLFNPNKFTIHFYYQICRKCGKKMHFVEIRNINYPETVLFKERLP